MEQVFYTLDHDLAQAHDILLAFTNDAGSRLALAHGFLGIVSACLREREVARLGGGGGSSSSGGAPAAEPGDVFRLCATALPFRLTAHDERLLQTKHSLAGAERHLARALELDAHSDFFVGFHAQVLLALGRRSDAVAELEKYYRRDKSVHILRMLMSVDARDPVDQGDRVLDCLELDPYAPEEYFDGAVGRLISSLEPGAQARALRLVVDRVERGDPQETGKWRQLARLLSLLRQSGGEAAVEAAMGERRRWWGEAYFGWHAFGGTRPPPAPPTEQAVYMAVCAQQLLDLEQGHPVYGILSGELDDALADFVDEHMRVL